MSRSSRKDIEALLVKAYPQLTPEERAEINQDFTLLAEFLVSVARDKLAQKDSASDVLTYYTLLTSPH